MSQGLLEVQIHKVLSDHSHPEVGSLDDPERLQHPHIAAVRPRVRLPGGGKLHDKTGVFERYKEDVVHGDEPRGEPPRVGIGSAHELNRVRAQAAEVERFAHRDGEVEQATAPGGEAGGPAHGAVPPLPGRGDLAHLLQLEAQPAGDAAGRGVHGDFSNHRLQLCRDGDSLKGDHQWKVESTR